MLNILCNGETAAWASLFLCMALCLAMIVAIEIMSFIEGRK
jgi:hypothetical protein